MKRCTRCGEIKPYSDFNIDRGKKDGYTPKCKPCIRARRMELREMGGSKWKKKRMKNPDISNLAYDPDLELKRRAENLIRIYGEEGALVKAKLIRRWS